MEVETNPSYKKRKNIRLNKRIEKEKRKNKEQGDPKCSAFLQAKLCVRYVYERRNIAMRLDLDKAPTKSAIAEHVQEQSMPHEVDWQGMKAIDRARWKRERKIREKAFHIQKRKPQLNRDGVVERSAIWNAII